MILELLECIFWSIYWTQLPNYLIGFMLGYAVLTGVKNLRKRSRKKSRMGLDGFIVMNYNVFFEKNDDENVASIRKIGTDELVEVGYGSTMNEAFVDAFTVLSKHCLNEIEE